MRLERTGRARVCLCRPVKRLCSLVRARHSYTRIRGARSGLVFVFFFLLLCPGGFHRSVVCRRFVEVALFQSGGRKFFFVFSPWRGTRRRVVRFNTGRARTRTSRRRRRRDASTCTTSSTSNARRCV